jgi:hypothetical protein
MSRPAATVHRLLRATLCSHQASKAGPSRWRDLLLPGLKLRQKACLTCSGGQAANCCPIIACSLRRCPRVKVVAQSHQFPGYAHAPYLYGYMPNIGALLTVNSASLDHGVECRVSPTVSRAHITHPRG